MWNHNTTSLNHTLQEYPKNKEKFLIRPVRRKYSKDMLCFKFRNKGWQRNQWSWSLYNDGEHSGRGGHDCFDPSNISLEGPGQRKYSAQVKLKRLRSLDAFGKTLICTMALFYDEVSRVYACFRPWGSMHQASVHSKLVQSFNYISIHFKRF